MNREDLIAKRARAYAYAELEKIGSNQTIWFTAPLFDSEDLQTAYLQGAKDADGNPAWRMCEDELPEKSDDYIVVYEDGTVFTEYFIATRKEWKHYLEESDRWVSPREKVIAWLPLPKSKV